MFNEAMQENEPKLGKVNRRVRGVMHRLVEQGGDTRKSVVGRLKDLEVSLDKG